MTEALDDLLAAIELRELRSLQWGFVDGSLREAEVDALAQQALGRHAVVADPADLVEELVSRRLVFEIGSSETAARYRSRFAESVRLLVHLRQLFDNRPWASSPRLVSDYRIDASPRRFARRDLGTETLQSALKAIGAWTDEREHLATRILARPSGPMDLSGFQLRVVERLLAPAASTRALIVTAGTGSGKTLAFYLPAVLEIGPLIQSKERWTKCVAVYPRIELLKDQFSEAFRLFRSADDELNRAGRRPIMLGALFSLTPPQARVEDVAAANWPRFGAHFICPFLRCPLCGSDMVWRREDLERGLERLECTDAPRCSGVASEHEVILTRRRMLGQPPDFVFTTIETLNQRLSDPRYRACLGVGRSDKEGLRLVLLDEVHTYNGTQGAHAALVLRRWRHAANPSLKIVGLSATLRDAPQFFSELTGVDERWVGEITPSSDEYEEAGMAYQIILRGDPGARTSLLSTSIQAGMLLPRLLDPRQSATTGGPSKGRFGRRVFVFTDDLDITNRLFDDLRDAEAYDNFGSPDPARAPLSALRSSAAPDPVARGLDGQRWDSSEHIGHDLQRRLGVTRTTSKDAGVSSGSEVVVATSALEVGFNDPQVGGIIQHKAPRSLAAYLQRKGRAGRTAEMRPWMVTVLSDYGRDRLVFQAYERLIDPLLPPQRLPIKNRYVLRMQAVFAFIDWLANARPAVQSKAWPWWPLNGPASTEMSRRSQGEISSVLEDLLDGDPGRVDSLRQYLGRSLGLGDRTEVDELLWGPPRSLLLEVVPTLSRRLRTQWVAAGADGRSMDLFSAEGPPHPLPDFLPASLFSDLNLPEVTVVVPPAARGAREQRESMPILQALRLLVPGRVTRRFAHERGGLNHWLPVPLDAAEIAMPIQDYAEQSEFVAEVPISTDGGERQVACFRPWSVRLQRAPMPVQASSNAEFHWLSRLIPTTDPVRLPVGASSPWRRMLKEVDFFLHSRRASVTVQRYAHEGTARVRLLRQEADHVVRVTLTDSTGSPAAIGFEQEVDGLRVVLELPSSQDLAHRARAHREIPSWRAAYFRDLVRHDPVLSAATNRFQRDWIHQIYLAALLVEAGNEGGGLREAGKRLRRSGVGAACREVMDQLFRFDPVMPEGLDAWEGDAADETPGLTEAPRLVRSLAPILEEQWVIDRLEALSSGLWSVPDEHDFAEWLRARIVDTIGEAVAIGCSYLVPAYAGSDALILDVLDADATSHDSGSEVWITESILGGAGILDAIGRTYAADPASFLRALDAAIAPSDLEVVAANLDRILTLLNGDASIRQAANAVRARDDHEGREAARSDLYALFGERGIGVDHSLSVALNQRLLRRGSNSDSDRLLLDLRTHWEAVQTSLGIAVDLRTFAYLAAVHPAFSDRLKEMVMAIAGHSPGTSEVVGVMSGILWPRPSEVRGRSLETHSPFRESGRADPALVRLVLEGGDALVEFGSDAWESRVSEALAEHGAVQLVANRDLEAELSGRLHRLLALPIDVGFLQFYPSVDRLQRDELAMSVRLVVRELA